MVSDAVQINLIKTIEKNSLKLEFHVKIAEQVKIKNFKMSLNISSNTILIVQKSSTRDYKMNNTNSVISYVLEKEDNVCSFFVGTIVELQNGNDPVNSIQIVYRFIVRNY